MRGSSAGKGKARQGRGVRVYASAEDARRDAAHELLSRAQAPQSGAGRSSRPAARTSRQSERSHQGVRASRPSASARRGTAARTKGSRGAGARGRGVRLKPGSPSRAAVARRTLRAAAGALGVALAALTAVGTGARVLPSELAALPYLPIVVSLSPWFVVTGVLALALSLGGRRWLAALVAVACVATQVSWQLPFFESSASLPAESTRSVTTASPNPIDAYARVMTLNVYKGAADPATIVNLVSANRIEVLALQETTDEFVKALEAAGIKRYLPYSNVASSDGVYGNGLWSVTPLEDPERDEVNSSASFMPSGTVSFSDGRTKIRFVSVHTTSPTRGYWSLWKRSLDELGMMRTRTDRRYVFMGDFNATYDHAPFRDMLGSRFSDATRQAGRGLMFTWPANRSPLPRFAGIDHIVIDQGIVAGRVEVHAVPGSDHAALIATIAVS